MKDLETPPEQPATGEEAASTGPATASEHETSPPAADAAGLPGGANHGFSSEQEALAGEAAAIEQLAIAEESASAGELTLPRYTAASEPDATATGDEPDDGVSSEPPADARELAAAGLAMGEASDPAADPVPADAAAAVEHPALTMEELLSAREPEAGPLEDSQLRAVLEAIVYVAEEPLTLAQLAAALQQPAERIRSLLDQLMAEFDRPVHGVTVREVAGGFKMATKPEHHDAVRAFVKGLKPPLKLSLPALETLAVIAYKQPVTGPEIMEIRGVQGAGVLKTLLDRKLIAVAGRKNVIGKPMLYKTTKEFLIQFGLKDLAELPSLKEFEEIRRMAFSDDAPPAPQPAAEAAPETPSDPAPAPEES